MNPEEGRFILPRGCVIFLMVFPIRMKYLLFYLFVVYYVFISVVSIISLKSDTNAPFACINSRMIVALRTFLTKSAEKN